MKVDPKAIKAAGGKVSELKKIFTLKPQVLQKKHPKVQELIELHNSRINRSITQNLENFRHIAAIDNAYDAPRAQITYSMVRGLIDSNPGKEEVERLAKSWGLHDMLTPLDPTETGLVSANGTPIRNTREKPGYKLNLPTFFNIYLPLVLAYVKIRWAKLYNDRDLNPYYKYEPVGLSMKQRYLCQILTNRVERMATQMGYREVEKQSIHGMLLYGKCINFVESAWHKDEQIIDGKKTVVREGLKFALPHPTRVFHDETCPLWTINTDTGVSWLGYWAIHRFGDLYYDKSFWNRDQISMGSNSIWTSSAWNIYNRLYPCVASFPGADTLAMNSGVENNDRESKSFRYTLNERDQAVAVTVIFDKIVPSEWGLYNYDYPVWHRFVYAGDRTVIYCEPVFYTPAIAYLYDTDANRAAPSSLGLELVPFQDHLGNMLTQYILTVKKNLIKIVGVNTDLIDAAEYNKMANNTENMLRGIHFMPFSANRLQSSLNQNINQAFEELKLGNPQNTTELVSCINMIITVLERVLGFSPQEVGGSASHQQSATEVSIGTTMTMSRIQFTGTGVDAAAHARKVALYEALCAYSSDKIMEDVADLTPDGARILEEAGFEVEMDPSTGSAGIIGDISSLNIAGIASYRDGTSRTNDPQVAQMMLTFFDRVVSNQNLVQMFGTGWIVEAFNQISDKFRFPLEFRLPTGPGQSQEQLQQSLEQMAQIAEAKVTEFAQGLAESLNNEVRAPLQQVGEAAAQIGQQVQNLEAKQAQDAESLRQTLDMIGTQLGLGVPAPAPQPQPQMDIGPGF